MSGHDTLGTGQIEHKRHVSIVHFGSPEGTSYTQPDTNLEIVTEMPTAEWLNTIAHGND